jgi:seryl-tRNA synthetase
MENNTQELPMAWTVKIERDAEKAARLQFHPEHSRDQNTACRITYRNGAMAYAPWLYTCQMNYAGLKTKHDELQQQFAEFKNLSASETRLMLEEQAKLQQQYNQIKEKMEKMEQALKEIHGSNCDYEDLNFKKLHSTECRACKAGEALATIKQEGEKEVV